MKKQIIIIVSIALATLIAVLGVVGFFVFGTNRKSMAKISASTEIRYGADTSSGSSLVQVGARLYYSVPATESATKYGIYEINNQGIRRVWWDGIKFNAENAPVYDNLVVYGEYLASVDRESGQISVFDSEKGNFVTKENTYSSYVTTGNDLDKAIFSEESAGHTSLFNKTYFVTSQEGKLKLNVKSADNKVTTLYRYETRDPLTCTSVYSSGACVYAEIDTVRGVECMQYNTESGKTKILSSDEYMGKPMYTEDGTYGVYVYNPDIYEEDDESVGIFVTNIETGERKRVYTGSVRDWYILDNMWIYFSLEDYSLYRVDYKGETLEQVF